MTGTGEAVTFWLLGREAFRFLPARWAIARIAS